jgi:hypothetical protein
MYTSFWVLFCAKKQCFPSSCDGRSDGVPCALGNAPGNCCAGACVRWSMDPDNCGQCGRSCDGARCLGGTCESVDPARCVPACPDGTICVEDDWFGLSLGVCVGPVCGVTAYDYPYIDNERCLAQDGAPGECCADGSCADIARDPQNCGGCGLVCATGSCVGGLCR